MVLYCAYCKTAQVVSDDVRPCAACGSHHFSTERRIRQRRFAYTVEDRRFLRSLRIAADDDTREEVPR